MGLYVPVIFRMYSIGKSSNRSPGNFSVLAKISNIQKSPNSRERYIILEVSY